LTFFTYMLASRRNGTLYVGSTDNLGKRIWDHKLGAGSAFTRKHGLKILVWFEQHETREAAFGRERRIKEWPRLWKLRLIERFNPGWRDLYETLAP
jgi:putative endonuclease